MEYTTLGRTGLRVSVAGLGCGGPSRLGLRANKTEKDAIALVRQALDMGVSVLDTAEVYGTEEIVGKVLERIPRDEVIISTKKEFPLRDPDDPAGELKQKGLVDPGLVDSENPLEFVIRDGKAATIPEAAYRYCRHEPGAHVVLTGTGNPEHLTANIESLVKPPLPDTVLARLREIFAKVDCVTGN